ncbi:putative mediator complex subunit 9 [Heterostelium album PN500]|uniref:Mediator of RNA polymerase II transcription subunit 9 n=1 Tax=Heterostelium pallidum (strain ATCC 26659 / Pp 5 / PN500) TaxID=670386 RepID=D3BL14_HETP5|nr:putative mediator complex subunit 9 [Heterostelium album PN500]EFA78594.1 putative mediator complex subunit 9 [Heterostelium album PN500]|eukprot:XP_020430718.1 putative mediator complex subunit 9 [Heterostelium album PN500]
MMNSKIEQEPQQSVEDLLKEFQLFPFILDIISRLKDDELEVSRAVNALNEKVAKSLRVLNSIPGTNRTLEEQELLLKSYKDKLRKKKELIAKLTEVEMFKKYTDSDENEQSSSSSSSNNNNIDQQQDTNMINSVNQDIEMTE